MKEALRMYYQASLLDIPSAISSQELESGHTHSETPDGQMIVPSGQGHAPANLSARQAKERGLLTSGTYGPHSTGSSASVDLMLSLANKLQASPDLLGSTLFSLTWKQRRMPSGRSICALRAGEQVPVVPNLYSQIWKGIQTEQRRVEQSTFGSDRLPVNPCETPMCIAGHTIHLAGNDGYKLASEIGAAGAALLIHRKSRPGTPAPRYDIYPNEWAIAYTQARAEEEE